MIDLTLEDLKQFLLDGRRARQYAWEHYEELAAREATYTLYGPYAYLTGAALPGSYIPKRARNLTLKTRRKKYTTYELDHEYRPLRVTQVLDSEDTNTFHFFELDGIQYACPFWPNKKKEGCGNVVAVRYKDGKPYYYAFLSENVLFVRFCEYVSQGRAIMTEYGYNPVSEYTLHGYPTNTDAPINALDSDVQRVCWEEEPMFTDFSQWVEKTDDKDLP